MRQRPFRKPVCSELGPNPDIIVRHAKDGSLFDYIEQHKVPAWSRPRKRDSDYWDCPQAKEQQLYANPSHQQMFDIIVDGEFYGVTKCLDSIHITRIYPYFLSILRHQRVEIVDQWTKELIYTNQ